MGQGYFFAQSQCLNNNPAREIFEIFSTPTLLHQATLESSHILCSHPHCPHTTTPRGHLSNFNPMTNEEFWLILWESVVALEPVYRWNHVLQLTYAFRLQRQGSRSRFADVPTEVARLFAKLWLGGGRRLIGTENIKIKSHVSQPGISRQTLINEGSEMQWRPL